MKINYPLLTGLLLLLSSLGFAQPIIGTTDFAISGTINWQASSACVSTKTANVQGWLISVSSTSNCGISQTDASGGDGRIQYLVGFGTLTQGTFGSDDGSEFALTELAWGVMGANWTNKPMTFVGYKNGMPVSGATVNATTPALAGVSNSAIVTFSNNSAFNDVDDIRISCTTTCNTTLFFEYITIGTATVLCPTPTVSLTGQTNVSCNSLCNGSATVSASGGAPFTYAWSPSGGTSASASGLCSGTYSCTVTNSCSASAVRTVTITEPAALTSFTAVTNALCNGSNGSATISATGGTGAYTYSWSTGATASSISGLAGAYTATVTDANNCKSSKSAAITQPPALVTNTSVTNVLCNGGNGSATITASGGTGAYTYSWSTGATASSISGLAGAYTATVTDANNCKSSKSANITQPSALVTSTSVTNVLCNGGNGSATITASGGTGAYTYSWSTGATASSISGLAGAYTATVTDANNCKSSKSANITQPSVLTTNTAITNVLCNGGNGSATITASGGTTPYVYSWSTGATSSVITAVAGVHTATVTDANNCTSIKSVNITEPSALVTNTAVTNILCNGNNGSATITASGGTGAYTYLWSTGATTSVMTALAGAHTATVTDANNCKSIKNVNITQPSALTTNTAVTNVLCNGGTGFAAIMASGGTGAYTYLWSTGATGTLITAVSGVYTATVTDANNCKSSKSANITQPPVLATSTAVTNVLCNGGNGSATITASGGTAPYTYAWSTAATTSVLSGVVSGVYTATVTDANNCTSSKSVNISQPTALATSSAITHVLCNGGNGSATITASGGTGAYTYLWSTGATTSVITAVAGVHTATVTDANNCKSSKSFNITQPSAIVVTANASPAPCFGAMGSATASASGGTGAYTYSWSNGATGAILTNAPAGAYTITVTDANGCKGVNVITITQPAALTSSAAVTQAACYGGVSSATVTNTGGTQPYNVLWPDLTINPVFSTNVGGVYTATVSDANSCTSISTVTLDIPSALTLSVYSSSSTVCAGSSFTLLCNASGGTAPRTYSWAPGPASNVYVFNPTVSGVYTAIVFDANYCATSETIAVTVIPTPTIAASGGAICPSESFTIIPSGALTYTYTDPSSTTTGSSIVVSPAVNTTYTISGTNFNGCISASSDEAHVTVQALVAPQLTITATQAVICSGETSTLTVTGANTYTWISPSSFASVLPVSPLATTIYTVLGTGTNVCNGVQEFTLPVNITPTVTVSSGSICAGESYTIVASGADTYNYSGGTDIVSPLVTTTYTVIGTSLAGCIGDIAISEVTVNAIPVISVNGGSLCAGASFTLAPTGAATYTFSSGSSIVSPLVNTTYSVIGTSAEGCLGANMATAEVTVHASPSLSVNSGTICSGESFTIVPGGALSYTFVSGSATVSPVVTTNYQIIGAGALGCESTIISTVVVNALPAISITSQNAFICEGETVILNANGGVTYTWSTTDTTESISITPSVSTVYTLAGTGTNGCVGSSSVNMNVTSCLGLSQVKQSQVFAIFPNPNNGTFNVNSDSDAEVSIVNELGQVVKHLKLDASNNRTVSVSELANGIYFITGHSNSHVIKQKIIVSK